MQVSPVTPYFVSKDVPMHAARIVMQDKVGQHLRPLENLMPVHTAKAAGQADLRTPSLLPPQRWPLFFSSPLRKPCRRLPNLYSALPGFFPSSLPPSRTLGRGIANQVTDWRQMGGCHWPQRWWWSEPAGFLGNTQSCSSLKLGSLIGSSSCCWCGCVAGLSQC